MRAGGAVQEPSPPPSTAETAADPILFVEDNRETSFVHQMAMKSSRYQAVFLTNVLEAREAIKVMRPELIVLDRHEKAALQAGATKFIPKPVSPFILLSTVQELVKGQGSKTVLLVDDDEVTRCLLGGESAKLGYRVLVACGAREAGLLEVPHGAGIHA